MDRIVTAFRLFETNWRTELKELFVQLQAERVSRKGIEIVLHYLTFYMDKVIAEMNPEYQQLWKTDILPAMNGLLDGENTIEEIAVAVDRLFCCFAELVDIRRETRNQGSVIKAVKAYIEANYTDPNLSLDHLQDKFGLNGKYLSRLFKEEYGLKFVDFLIDLRMQEARRLLLESHLSVQDITERLGYSSPISFARTFRKVVGMSPVDFRKGK
jgi:two-component system response regulator YesN